MIFFYSIHFEKLSLQNRRLIKKIILIWVKMSLTTTIKRGNPGPVPNRWLCFCPNFLSFYWSSLVAFGEFTFQKLVTNQLLGWNFVQCGRIHFTFTKIMNKSISTKNRVLISLVGPSETGKTQLTCIWLKVGTFQPTFNKIYIFYQHSQRLYGVMQKENWKSLVCAGSNLWKYWFGKKQLYKVLVNFWRLSEEICISKAFVGIATAGKHQCLSTIYIKHNLFQLSKLGRDIELQNTHIVLLKSPRDVMQVTTLSTQFGLGLELVEWFRDATSVPFGHLLIDSSPRTEDRSRYCTNTGSIPLNFYIPDRLRQSIILDDEHTKFLYSPNVPIIFPQMQKCFPSVLPKKVYPVSLRMHNKSAQRKPAKHKKTTRGKSFWRPERDILAWEKGAQLTKVNTLPVINLFFWYRAVCPRSCLCVPQKFDYPVSYKAGTSKVSTFRKYHVPSWFTQEWDKRKKNSKADSLVDKILSCPRIKPTNSQTLILDGVETGNFLSDFAQQLRRKNADVPDI